MTAQQQVQRINNFMSMVMPRICPGNPEVICYSCEYSQVKFENEHTFGNLISASVAYVFL